MAKYLVLYSDGCNGVRRGGVTNVLPEGFWERNEGEKVFESDSPEGTWYVELLGEKEPEFEAES